MAHMNHLPVDFQTSVIVMGEDGTTRMRRQDEFTNVSSLHQHFLISRAISVSQSP